MIQHHYKSICGTRGWSPCNEINIKLANPIPKDNLYVIDDLGRLETVGRVFNLYYYSETQLSNDEFTRLVAQEVQKVQGFEYIDSEYLKAAEITDYRGASA